jgi:DNA modification methylase
MNKMIIHGDCVDVMEDLIKKKVRFESIVTDPPYELGFMGKDWDKSGIANSKYMWSLAFKLLQPGGHLLAFSGTRTYHRMVVAIEDAGFEIRDMISWLYGQGFPKSLDISKAIDKEAGVEREVVGVRQYGDGHIQRSTKLVPPIGTFARTQDDRLDSVAATDEAKQWQGWGTALKPACEPIVVARKPLIEGYTVSENVLTTGTGGLNIDGCRVGTERLPEVRAGQSRLGTFERHNMVTPEREGRWPANVVHDGNDEVEEAFAKFGNKGGGDGKDWSLEKAHGTGDGATFFGVKPTGKHFADTGTASRFFYCAKTSKRERAGSKHPTVKPLALMKWLVTLVTPPDGTVLDPFCGTGTTCVAAKELGFDFVGIELDEEMAEFARNRLDRKDTFVEDFVIEDNNVVLIDHGE